MAYTEYEDQVFQTKYKLALAPEANVGFVQHDIFAIYSSDGEVWHEDQHWTIVVPAEDLEAVLLLPDGGAKVRAYKQLLVDNRDSGAPVPLPGKTAAEIEARANAYNRALSAASGALEYIQSIQATFPTEAVTFSLVT